MATGTYLALKHRTMGRAWFKANMYSQLADWELVSSQRCRPRALPAAHPWRIELLTHIVLPVLLRLVMDGVESRIIKTQTWIYSRMSLIQTSIIQIRQLTECQICVATPNFPVDVALSDHYLFISYSYRVLIERLNERTSICLTC